MAPITTDNCEFECATSVDSSINGSQNNNFENDIDIDIDNDNFVSNASNVSNLSQVQVEDHVEQEQQQQQEKQQQMPWEAPGKQGLYDPQNEHEACGVGFIVAIDGKRSHKVNSLFINNLHFYNSTILCTDST